MADNVTLPATGTGTATPVIASDDVAGVQYQRVKVDHGGDGAASPWLNAALADNTANPTVPGVAAFLMVWDGSNWDRLPGDALNGIEVQINANSAAIGGVYPVTGHVMTSGSVEYPIKSVGTSVASSGDNTIVSGVTSKNIRVLSWSVQAQGSVTVRWEDGSGTNISAPWQLLAREGVVKGPEALGHFYFESAAGQALVLNLSAAITVGVEVVYIEYS